MALPTTMLDSMGGEFKRAMSCSLFPRIQGRRLSLVSATLVAVLTALSLRAAEPERPNVLLITLDTIRAHHFSSYGYHLRTTPNLDQLASEGARFERAYTAIPMTGPAHVSLFTSRYPQEHGSKVNGQRMADDPRLVTITEILHKQGYRTAAYVSAWPLKERLTGLNKGFEVYDQEFNTQYQMFNSFRSANEVTPKAVEWLQTSGAEPFFLWVHYFDPHKPYRLHSPFDDLPENEEGGVRSVPLDKGMADRIRRYDSEVAFMDYHIGKLIRELSRLGIDNSTLVIVVGDHGESLGEGGYIGHGRYLFESIVRVPLIIRYPQLVPAGRVVREHVSILDVMPTLIDVLEIEYPLPLQGESLRPLFDEANGPVRERPDTTYFVTFPGKPWQMPKWFSWLWHRESKDRLPLKLGWIRGEQKVVWTPKSKTLELFTLGEDGNGAQPVFFGKVQECSQDEVTQLQAWFEATLIYRDEEFRLRREDIEVLKSLGYVSD
jgi:arylsulfatase A-like enzyme